MKLLAADKIAFRSLVDDSFGQEESIVLRYRNAMRFLDDEKADFDYKDKLRKTSIREGARVVRLFEYKNVSIHVLDETSKMATGSLKAIDGCLTSALCLQEGVRQIVFESGGNTGSALTRYGHHAGLETFLFCPVDNLDLLDSELFRPERSHLAAVADRRHLKEFAGIFAELSGMRHVPDRAWRYAASMLRGLHILERILEGNRYDWISQTISAAFGPIGIYRVLDAFRPDLSGIPRFLGLQQEANCPMYAAWQGQTKKTAKNEIAGPLLTKVMYDGTPQTYRTYDDLCSLLQTTGGELLTVNETEFTASLDGSAGSLLQHLLSKDISITMRSGDIIEKTGLVTLAGTLKAIDAGIIRDGSTVLCCVTGGVTDADGRAEPEYMIRNREDVVEYLGKVAGEKS